MMLDLVQHFPPREKIPTPTIMVEKNKMYKILHVIFFF